MKFTSQTVLRMVMPGDNVTITVQLIAQMLLLTLVCVSQSVKVVVQ